MPHRIFFLLAGAGACTVGCGGSDSDKSKHDDTGADQSFGETAIVTIINPVANDGHTEELPSVAGTQREGIVINAEPGDEGVSDETGLAVLDEVSEGQLELIFDGGPSSPFAVLGEGDIYDLAVAYDGDDVEAFPQFPIRYPVGGEILTFDEASAADALIDALDTDDIVVLLRGGIYVGDLVITGENVLFFGEGFTETQVVLDGNVTVRGGRARLRGFTITGNLIVNGNGFGMSFSTVLGDTDIKGNSVAFLRNAFCGTVRVPSSSASLLDNRGMAPLEAELTEADCELSE